MQSFAVTMREAASVAYHQQNMSDEVTGLFSLVAA